MWRLLGYGGCSGCLELLLVGLIRRRALPLAVRPQRAAAVALQPVKAASATAAPSTCTPADLLEVADALPARALTRPHSPELEEGSGSTRSESTPSTAASATSTDLSSQIYAFLQEQEETKQSSSPGAPWLFVEEDEVEVDKPQVHLEVVQRFKEPTMQDSSFAQHGGMFSCTPCECDLAESARPRTIVTLVGLAYVPPQNWAMPAEQTWRGTI